jgi:hypothetical protein
MSTDRQIGFMAHVGPIHTLNTQTQKQDEPPLPYPPPALPSTFMASFTIAPTHGAIASHESVLGTLHCVCACCSWFTWLGYQNMTRQK